MKTDSRYLLVNLYQTIPKVWLWVYFKLGSLFMHPFQCAARESRIMSNMVDILIEVMHLYNTRGLTCYQRIRVNELCTITYLRQIPTVQNDIHILLIIVKICTSLHFIINTFSNKTYSLLSGQVFQAIQACNCKAIRFKSVRWHDDGSSEHAPPSVYPEDPSSFRLTCI